MTFDCLSLANSFLFVFKVFILYCSIAQFSSIVQFSCSVMSDFATAWTSACQVSLFITNSQSLLRLMSIESVMPYNHLIPCRLLLLPPSIIPVSGSFQISQFFASGGQSIGVSASASVLLVNIQLFPLGWTGWISLLFKGLSGIFSTTRV